MAASRNPRARLMLLKPEWPVPLVTSYDRRTAAGAQLEFASHKAQPSAVVHIGPDETEHYVSTAAGIADLKITEFPTKYTLTLIPDAEWTKFVQAFMRASAQAPSLTLLILLAEHGVPVCGPKVRQIILDDHNHWRSTLADLVYERDVSGFGALVLVHRDKSSKEAVVLPSWIQHTHLKKTWFAFKDMENAMSVKFSFPQCTMIEL